MSDKLPVREFINRIYQENKKLSIPAEIIRNTGNYFEVVTSDLTDHMEEWLIENANSDDYYYCITNAPMFNQPGIGQRNQIKVCWFFDTAETAAMFKLTFT